MPCASSGDSRSDDSWQLFNDILITLGVYSLSGREVSIDTVAAVLTVLGYSIYDTIIVFDRIRENMPLMRKASFATIANISVWETLRRSITTSVMTLFPIVSLIIFGGATLKDFAFALLIGIGPGACSTIFVATPFLTVLMERSPEFKRRAAPEDIGEDHFASSAVPRQLLRALGGLRRRMQRRRRRCPRRRRSSSRFRRQPRRSSPTRPAANGGASGAGRGRTAVPANPRITEAIEELLGELPARVRGTRTRFGEQTLSLLRGLVEELDLVTRDEFDELELRVAQLEHRLSMLEEQHDAQPS